MTAAVVGDVAVNRHAWLQKHPSPLATGGEFHWYPDAGDRELRAGFIERVRGLEPPAVLWQLERGRIAWGQVFSATAPLDGRRYVGLVLSVVEGERTAADLLSRLAPPPPAPWTDGVATESRDRRLAAQQLAALRRGSRGDAAAVARALLSGGIAGVDDPTAEDLPQWIASIERVLPEPGPAPRCGAWCAGGAIGSRDRVAELAAAAWREPASRAARGWTLLCELAIARGESVDRVGVALEAVDPTGDDRRPTGKAVGAPTARASASPSDPTGDDRRPTGKTVGAPPPGTSASPSDPTGADRRSSPRDSASPSDPTGEDRRPTGKAVGAPTARASASPSDPTGADRPTGKAVGAPSRASALLLDAAAVLTAGERAELAGCDRVIDVLHAWGRGRLDRSPTADTLPARLADLVALRVLARLAADDDPSGAIAEARWYALLSARRRQALLAAVAQRTTSLRALVEAHHA